MAAQIIGRWKGAIPGALAVGVVLLSGVAGLLPDRIVTVALLFGGGIITGLLTPGTVRDGAVTGAVCGLLVVLIMASVISLTNLVVGSQQYPSPGATFGFYALILTPIFLSCNAIGGAAGTVARLAIRGGGAPARTAGAGERDLWPGVGIGIGTIIIAAPALLVITSVPVTSLLGPLLMIAPVAGGLVAGFSAGRAARDGLESGFVAALFGTALISIPFIQAASYSEGFAAGLAGIAVIALGYIYMILGTAAGGAGAVLRAGIGQGVKPRRAG